MSTERFKDVSQGSQGDLYLSKVGCFKAGHGASEGSFVDVLQGSQSQADSYLSSVMFFLQFL